MATYKVVRTFLQNGVVRPAGVEINITDREARNYPGSVTRLAQQPGERKAESQKAEGGEQKAENQKAESGEQKAEGQEVEGGEAEGREILPEEEELAKAPDQEKQPKRSLPWKRSKKGK